MLALCLAISAYIAMPQQSSLNQLQELTLGAVEVHGAQEIRYCPDNTCDVFHFAKPASLEQFADYVFLYLFYEGGYIYLEKEFGPYKPFRKIAAPHVEDILARNALFCSADQMTPECVLRGIERQLEGKLCSARYDEGMYCETCDGQTKCSALEPN